MKTIPYLITIYLKLITVQKNFLISIIFFLLNTGNLFELQDF